MKNMEQMPVKNRSYSVEDLAVIQDMSETTVEAIRAKKQAYNDLILSLDGQINLVQNETGSNSPDDNSGEAEQNNQDWDRIKNAMDRARSEMVRLGDKEELELKKAV